VFPLQIRVHAPSIPIADAENLVRATQHALDDLNDFSAHHLRLRLVEAQPDPNTGKGNASLEETDIGTRADAALTVTILPNEDVTLPPAAQLHQFAEQLTVTYPTNIALSQSTANSPLAAFIAGELQKLFAEEKATIEYILSNSNMLGPNLQPSITGGLAAQGSQSSLASSNKEQRSAAMKSVAPQLMDAIARRSTRSFKYAETYHLSFSLFTPGGKPSSWDIEPALQEYLLPLLRAYSPISNFSIDTQVQPYSTFSPTAAQPEYDETKSAWTLKKDDLSGFINAAEWPLSPSIGGGPTINFILYVPEPSQSPLLVKENGATSWTVPQWGGVFILNPPMSISTVNGRTNPPHLPKDTLRPALSTFTHQLLSLLGTPSTPASSLSLRLQSLTRIHTASLFLSASSTLGSLARLTNSLASIPIPLTVATSVSSALSQLSEACTQLRDGRFSQALVSARIAEHEAERSFFEKSMVGQVYFPDEHKIAVYMPLLGPIGVPLMVNLGKEIRRVVANWRAARASRSI
jgi:phosphatidylinositol glycan class S